VALWTTEEADGIVVAAYENPPNNVVAGSATEELGELIEDWERPDVRAAIICGRPEGQYLTHYDVEGLLALARDRATLEEIGHDLARQYQETLESLTKLSKPVIAAMNGDALGGGLEVSLACDIRIAEQGAFRIGMWEASLDLSPGGGGIPRLARLIGVGNAIDLVMRARILTPDEALAKGVVHEVVPDSRARAREIAGQLVKRSPTALRVIKRAAYGALDATFAGASALEVDGFVETMATDQAVASMESYVALSLDEQRRFVRPGS
jgi:enoyl-CoA hydratase